MSISVYLAASLEEMDRVRAIARHFERSTDGSVTVCSHWHEPGWQEARDLRRRGRDNLEDLRGADVIAILVGKPSSRGGRHVELGIAIEMGIKILIAGVDPAVMPFIEGRGESSFAHLEEVEWVGKTADYSGIDELLVARLGELSDQEQFCAVRGCRNARGLGRFVGRLCAPCEATVRSDYSSSVSSTLLQNLRDANGALVPAMTRDRDMDALLARCFEILTVKGRDYTVGSPDRLANFRRSAEHNGITPMQSLGNLMYKHYAAVSNYIKTGGQSESEPIRERLADVINFCLLLGKMIAEAKAEAVTALRNADGAAAEPVRGLRLSQDDIVRFRSQAEALKARAAEAVARTSDGGSDDGIL